MKPLRDIVLVLPSDEQDQTESGIILPETSLQKPLEGKVIAVGPGKDEKPMTVQIGDNVLYGRSAGLERKIDGKVHLLMRETDILAIL